MPSDVPEVWCSEEVVSHLYGRLAAAEARAAEAERRLRELALKLFPFGCASCQEFHDRIIAALAETEADHAG